MKTTKNIRLLILLVVLAAFTAGYVLLSRQKATVVGDPMMFRLADASGIDHVTLESHDKTIDLKFDGINWKINGRYQADPQLIKVLMATILQVAPKRPVAKQQADSINRRLDIDGVKVNFYAGPTLEKTFTAGGNTEKTEAYFRNSDGVAWRTTIPGYRVYAAGIFEVGESDWREKRVFNFNWRNFRKLKLEYPKDPASNFEIARQEDFLGVVGLENPDSTRINTFLNDVLTLSADKIIASGVLPRADSIVKTAPYLILTVEDVAKRTYRLELFALALNGGMIPGKALENEIVLFDRKSTFPVIKKKGYFKAK